MRWPVRRAPGTALAQGDSPTANRGPDGIHGPADQRWMRDFILETRQRAVVEPLSGEVFRLRRQLRTWRFAALAAITLLWLAIATLGRWSSVGQ